MNNKTIIILIVVVMGGYWLFQSGSPSEQPAVKEPSAPKDVIVANFLKQYPTINTTPSSSFPYTFQFEDQIIKPGKPIIFTGQLDDIFRKQGVLYIRFSQSWLDFDNPQQYYTLSGCEDKIHEMIKRKNGFEEYVVVAKIDSVEKPILKIDGSVVDENSVE